MHNALGLRENCIIAETTPVIEDAGIALMQI